MSNQVQGAHFEQALKLIPDEAAARSYFTKIRWQHGQYCPYCGYAWIVDRLNRKYGCLNCGWIFSITVGTIFEDTKLTLRKWLLSITYVLEGYDAADG